MFKFAESKINLSYIQILDCVIQMGENNENQNNQ